ncbi:MAG TPA: hypothetical protein VGM86_05670 [Thermoanaerobaculia bacterium]
MRAHSLKGLRLPAPVCWMLCLLAGAVLLLASPSPASAVGRATFNDMVVQRCPKGSCPWKLSCGVEGKPEAEMFAGAKAKTKYSVNINKGLDIQTFPADVRCTAWLDTGWIGTSWEKLNTTTINVPAGGEYTLDINSSAQGSVTVRLSVDSLEITTPPPPPAAPAPKGKKGAAAAPPAAPAAPQVLAVFSPEPEGRAVVIGMEWNAFKKRVDDLGTRGLQLTEVSTFDQGGKVYWNGIFRSSQQPILMLANQDGDTFLKNWKTGTGNRKRLFNLTIYPSGGKILFTGLFRDLGDKHSLWVGQNRKEFAAKVKELKDSQGLQLIDVTTYKPTTTLLYAGAFRYEETPNEYWQALDRADFDKRWQAARGKQMQLIDLETYKDGNQRLFDAIVHGGTPGEAVIGVDLDAFVARWRDMVAKGLRPTGLKVYRD